MDPKEALKVLEENMCPRGDDKGKCIVVLDRGWIFVGKLTRVDDDGYLLTECSNIRKWSTGGFGGLTKSSATSGAVQDSCSPIKFRDKSMLFYVPVSEEW